jgi:methylase of polypeptide subunit release factors
MAAIMDLIIIILKIIDKLLPPQAGEKLKKLIEARFMDKKRTFAPLGFGRTLSVKELVPRLHKKYPLTNFYIADDEARFYKLIAENLIESIKECESSLVKDAGLLSAHVRVGLICGPMAHQVADWIGKHRKNLHRDNFREVVFVAMNKAAKLDRFEYSANYLVSLFQHVFQNSHSIVYTFNPYDRTRLNQERRSIDILLCSIGSRNQTDYYFGDWYTRMLDGGFAASALPANCIGDFCLTPMDAIGRIVKENGIMEFIRDNLDPYPLFDTHVREVKAKEARPVKVIVPVGTFYQKEGEREAQEHGITGKETVTRAVLRAGAADICIMSRLLAENLERAIGGYVINKISQKTNKGLRKCEAILLDDGTGDRFSVYDHRERIDRTRCRVDPALEPPSGFLLDIPKIIISELGDEAKDYDWKTETGKFEYHIGDGIYTFDLIDKDVRRPGQWSLVTMQLARQCLAQVYQSRGDKLSVLDMGCGCGVVGLLMSNLPGDMIKRIVFSDVFSKALECTRVNYEKYYTRQMKIIPEYKQGSLFNVCEDEEFDVVAFNPPFLPTNTPSKFKASDSVWINGKYVAELYCENLYEHLTVGGWGILTAADYFDNGLCKEILETKFGKENVVQEDRVILYPCHPEPPIHPANEIENQFDIERNFHYNFEKCFLGDEEFLVFKMRHYMANRVR